MNKLDTGVVFCSHEEFLSAKRDYEEASKTVLIFSKAEKLKTTDSMVSQFRYRSFTLSCKAGRERRCQSKGLRKSSTIKRNCSFEVRVVLREDKYCVRSSKTLHENHNVDEQTYKHYTENMRLNESDANFVLQLLQAGANTQKVKNILMQRREGRPVSLKSIHNINSKFKRDTERLVGQQTELEKLLESMQQIPNARVKVAVDEQNELLGILFQDERMARLYEKYPELLLVDATYKLNNRRIPLFILLIVDGNGQSEIACLWFIKSESKECIGPMIDAFKELNLSWSETKVIISDKDLSERIVFSEKFNGIPIQICLFHALRNFNREVTTAKRSISAAQREVVLDILVRMAYSRSSAEYDHLYTELKNLKLPAVIEYFDSNWHTIRNEWTLHGKNEWNNYMNYTNNRVESLNQKIKIIGTHYASLLGFFNNIVQSYSVISSERDIKVVKSSMKIVRQRFDDVNLQKYNEFLTSYVFDKVSEEYKKSDKVPFTSCSNGVALTKYGEFQEIFTKEDICSCGFFKTMQLPCRHIFQLRKLSNLDLFEPNLCALRWSKQYYYASHPALNHVTLSNRTAINCTVVRVPEEIEKYKSAAKVTKDINGLLSSLSPVQYTAYMDKLKNIRNEISIGDSDRSVISHASESIVTAPLDLTWNSNSTTTDITMTEQQGNRTNSILNSDNGNTTIEVADVTVEMADATIQQGSTQIVENCSPVSNSIEIRKISLPRKNIVKGRPKGSGRTVVGTKKKDRKNASTIAIESAGSADKRITRSANKILSRNVQSKSLRTLKRK